MRAFTLWLMMCLLPLRLLAGDAMAVQMQAAGGHAPAPAVSVVAAAQSVRHDCHEQATGETTHPEVHAHANVTGAEPANQPHPGHAMCGLCDVCHNTLHTAHVALLPSQALAHVLPATLTPLLSSAERLPGFKPPIA